jgi:hypothetical protein
MSCFGLSTMEARCQNTCGRHPLVAVVDRPRPSGVGRNASAEALSKAGIGYVTASAALNRLP